jgi:hypothetical protein
MNIRDVATHWYNELQRIRSTLDNFENFDDAYEMIAVAQELAADIHSIEGQLDTEFDLGMDDCK